MEKAIGIGNNLPILKNIKILATKKNQITFISTNLELGIKHSVLGKVIEEGELVVPFEIFNSIIKNLKSEKIYLDYEDRKLKIKADNYEGIINCDNYKEFPIIPTIENKTNFIKIKGSNLVDVLNRVSIATQYSEIRPEINGIYLTLKENRLVFVGTDSFRLIKEEVLQTDFETTLNVITVIIPLNTVYSLLKILDCNDDVKIYTDSSQILIENNSKSIISRLIDGNYPDYESIIPKKTDIQLFINREELESAIKLTKNFVGKANDIIFNVSKKVLEVYSSNDIVGENNYRVPVSLKGNKKDFKISFNWKFILDSLKIYKDDTIIIDMNNPEKAVVIRDKENKNIIYIVMPIRQ